ncbi:phosphotransferase [Paenibacillus sp. ACRRX]|uniref:phosphotransferase n=1 Tax=Paenibacillus sp. ACRRX TaxID=2918206 RepID=UPI001EF5CED7|nr:phosphotransferase [Paenibacillus sp. ACRRX]MCG7409105.1 phosphotransferase [Paenibacillus sp. ACRRX]
MSIPEKCKHYIQNTSIGDQITQWQLLRHWSLSEVYRIKLASGGSRIIKWGGSEMAREADVYIQLLAPLHIRVPHLYDHWSNTSGGLILIEDAGTYDLEKQPESELFLEAARELARLRVSSIKHLELGAVPLHVRQKYDISAQAFIDQLFELQTYDDFQYNPSLEWAANTFPTKVKELYACMPYALVHHDYFPKNLIVQHNRILVIDWSNAYLSPHLGDLHGLIQEAQSRSGVSRDHMLHAYTHELQQGGSNYACSHISIDEQVDLGGLCWYIRTLHWLIHRGKDIIPGSIEWIPPLLDDLSLLVQRMQLK